MDFEAVLTTFSLPENLTNFEKTVLVGYAGGLPCVVGRRQEKIRMEACSHLRAVILFPPTTFEIVTNFGKTGVSLLSKR